MNPLFNRLPYLAAISAQIKLLGLLGGVLLALAACGGGGSSVAGVSSGGTGSYSSGPVTGFGSVILNGNSVRLDDASATVTDEDGNAMRGKLKLGMVARVKGSASSTGADGSTTATAQSIMVSGELQGPIDSGTIDTGAKSFQVLGQTVKVTGSTIIDTSIPSGFNSLVAGNLVEVHGVLDPDTNTLSATFIEKKASVDVFKVQGTVSAHDATAKEFTIGSIRVGYGTTAAAEVRVEPRDGTLVRVRFAFADPAPAVWPATRIRPPEVNNDDVSEAEIEGSITAYTSPSQFSVNGIPVNSSSVSPAPTGLGVGVRVEVKGSMSAGTLTATQVKIETDAEISALKFELHGPVSGFVPGTPTFVVRGVEVRYTGGTEFKDGTDATLTNGRSVEVRGTASDPSTRSSWINATRITFK